jgi:hypothetical protein
VVVVANAAAGVWALGANWWRWLRGIALWIFVAIAELTIVVQIVMGVMVVKRYDLEVPRFHAFYGFVALIAVAIIYSYRVQMRHRLYLLYGLGSLFVMGLAIRAMVLAPPR